MCTSITVEGTKVIVNERTGNCGYGTAIHLETLKLQDVLKLLYYKVVYILKERLKTWVNYLEHLLQH